MKPLLALLVTGCSLSPLDPSHAETPDATAGPRDAGSPPPLWKECLLVPEKLYVPGDSGSCYAVRARDMSILRTCDGTIATAVDLSQRQPVGDFVVTSFHIPGGGCYEYYACGDMVESPEVKPCG